MRGIQRSSGLSAQTLRFSEILDRPVKPGDDSGNRSCISLFAAPSRQRFTFPPELREHHMSFYDATVPAFSIMLTALSGLLKKAEAYCKAKNIQPDVLLNARLYPDMLPLTRQIQLACDFAGKSAARLAHIEVPTTPDPEKSFGELQQRIANTLEYLQTFKPEQFEGSDRKDLTFPPAGPNTSMTLKGQEFVNRVAFPNFYFHVATAHGILRHNGVEIGKRDFLGVA
jgi:uncharacterized protein